MRICIAGKNNIAISICQYLQTIVDKKSIYAIVNKTDTGKNLFQRSFLLYAKQQNIPIVSLEDIYEWEDLLFISLEFDQIIKTERFKSTALYNIHFSLLPKYKGMYTSALPILYDEQETGVTLHCIDQGIDTGDILAQIKIPILEKDTAKSLYLKYIITGTQLVKKELPMLLMGKVKAYSQTNTGSTYFSKATIDYSHLKINTIATASQISNQIRAFCFRDYQLPTFEGFDIFYAIPTLERSLCKPGVILENNDQYIKLSTIDYNVLLYKDKLNELINHCKNGNLAALRNQEDLPLYIDEREKEHGWNMLMVATYFNRKDIVSYLLSIGADVNSQNYNGTTVLMYAKDAGIKSNDFSILFYLLEHGGNLFARDYSGKRLLDYVRQESDELYFLLKKYHD